MNPQQAAIQARREAVANNRKALELQGERDRALAREAGAIAAVKPVVEWQKEAAMAASRLYHDSLAAWADLNSAIDRLQVVSKNVSSERKANAERRKALQEPPALAEFDDKCAAYYDRMQQLLEENALLANECSNKESQLQEARRELAQLQAVPPKFLRNIAAEIGAHDKLDPKGLQQLGLACLRWAYDEQRTHPDRAAAVDEAERLREAAQHSVERAEGRDGTVPYVAQETSPAPATPSRPWWRFWQRS